MRAVPAPTDIRWAEIESLLNALGVTLVERAGSRVQLVKGPDSIVVHKPHPRPEIRRETVRIQPMNSAQIEAPVASGESEALEFKKTSGTRREAAMARRLRN